MSGECTRHGMFLVFLYRLVVESHRLEDSTAAFRDLQGVDQQIVTVAPVAEFSGMHIKTGYPN